jgi:hypothetical protein
MTVLLSRGLNIIKDDYFLGGDKILLRSTVPLRRGLNIIKEDCTP